MEKNTTPVRIDRPVVDIIEVAEGEFEVVVYTDTWPDIENVEALPDTPRRSPLRVH